MSDLDVGPTVSVDSYSPFTLNATVGVTVGGIRKVTVTHGLGGQPTELTHLSRSGGPPEIDMEKLNEIDTRLRAVENDISTIKERLLHMPKTTQMWVSMGTCAVLILGGMWTLMTTMAPGILQGAVKGLVAEEVAREAAKTPVQTEQDPPQSSRGTSGRK